MNTTTKQCLAMLSALIFLLAADRTADASGFMDGLGKLDAHMSEFNPVGHYLIDPVNAAVPRLHLKGYLRLDTNFNTHSDKRSLGAGHIRKDWRAQKIEWLGELEADYRLNDSWRLVSVVNFLYDSVYDWQSSRGLYADRTDTTSEYYHRGDQILRECYLAGYWGNFDIYLGKQQVVWGKMEGRVLDIVNPMDNREFPPAEWQDDYEYRRIPLWMANITYNWDESSLQVLWIPDFKPNYGPTPGAAYFPPFINIPSQAWFKDSSKPSTSLKDNTWAARYNLQHGNWEYSLVYMYGWSYSPTNFRRQYNLTSLRDGLIKLKVEPKHTRLHHFGAMAETSFFAFGKHIIVSNEAVLTLNKYYSVDNEPLTPRNLGDGVRKSNELFVGSRWMTSFDNGELNVILQPLARLITGYNHHYSSPGTNQKLLYGALGVFARTWATTGDRLTTAYYILGWANASPSETEGVRQLFELRWKVSDYISSMLYYEWFNGSNAGIYGAYTKYDNLGFKIKYEF